MLEVEAKVLEVDVEALQKKLGGLGAKKVFEGKMESAWFEPSRGKVIRLRREGEKTFLCVKTGLQKSGGAKQAEESEVAVESFEAAKKVLEALGYSEKSRAKKRRASYELEGARFEIDFYEGIPPLLEVEAASAEAVAKWVKRLGFAAEEAKPWSFGELLEYYEGRRGE